nr:hypothetical protein [Tanacetum cinerariifolium]
MGDENHIRTLGYCSKPSHEGYKNTIELPEGNNAVPLRSNTIRTREEKSTTDEAILDDINGKPDKSKTIVSPKEVNKENEAKNTIGDNIVKRAEEKLKKINEEKSEETPNSQPIRYYLKHTINEKLTYNLLPMGPIDEAILKKKITRKEDFKGNFEIPCNVGGLKHLNALVDQGSNVNVITISVYKRLTDERPAETGIRLFLVSHSYIYPLGIAEDVLVDVDGYVYPVDFVILDIKEDENMPFILGISFLATTKPMIKFDKEP